MSGLPLAIARLADLAEKVGAAPLTKFEGCWEHQIDSRWWVAWNGHGEPIKSSRGGTAPPYTCLVDYNGWPAGMIDPTGGIIAAGEGANEDNFIAAIEAAIAALTEAHVSGS